MATERKALPVIDKTRCTGCGWCVAVCPPHVHVAGGGALEEVFASLHDEPGCTGCAKCAVKCPFDAITMVRQAGVPPGEG